MWRRSSARPLKSVTTPIAMGIAERIGGILSHGGARHHHRHSRRRCRPLSVRRAGVRDLAIRGFATGVTAHGIGTARAFQESEQAGAFSALAMA